MSINIQEIVSALGENQDNPLFEQVSYSQVSKESLSPLDNKDNNQKPGDLIQEAEQEVLFQSYKFEVPSEGYDNINAALIALRDKANRDNKQIVVNILINTRGILAETFLKPNDAGNLRGSLPEDSEKFKINIVFHQAETFGSYHSKMIIVDRRKSIIRGCEPSRANATGKALIETGALIEGEFSQELSNDFIRSWNKYCLPEQKMIPTPPAVTKPAELSSDKDKIPVAFLSKKANGNIFRYTNYNGPFKVAFLKAIEQSQTSINILTPNINDPEIIIALAKACNRGVRVKIAISKTFNETREAQLGGTNTQSIMLMAQMIEPSQLDYLDVRWSTKKDGTITQLNETDGIHGKFACFDDEVVITGSSPLDIQGTLYSKEADIIFQDKDKAAEFNTKLFNKKFETSKNFRLHAYETIVTLIQEAAPALTIPTHSGTYYDQSNTLIQSTGPILKKTLDPDSYRQLMDKINDELQLMGVRTKEPVNVLHILYEQRKRILIYALITAVIVLAAVFSGGIIIPVIAAIIGVAVAMGSEGKTIQQYMSRARPAEITISKYQIKGTQVHPAQIKPIGEGTSLNSAARIREIQPAPIHVSQVSNNSLFQPKRAASRKIPEGKAALERLNRTLKDKSSKLASPSPSDKPPRPTRG